MSCHFDYPGRPCWCNMDRENTIGANLCHRFLSSQWHGPAVRQNKAYIIYSKINKLLHYNPLLFVQSLMRTSLNRTEQNRIEYIFIFPQGGNLSSAHQAQEQRHNNNKVTLHIKNSGRQCLWLRSKSWNDALCFQHGAGWFQLFMSVPGFNNGHSATVQVYNLAIFHDNIVYTHYSYSAHL